MPAKTLLLVEDFPGDARLVTEALREPGVGDFIVETVDRLSAALDRLSAARFDAVLLDLGLPDSQGLATLTTLLPAARGLPVIVLTGLDDAAVGEAAIRDGAQDYLVKDSCTGDRLGSTLRYSIRRKELQNELEVARVALTESEAKYRALFESAVEAILLVDAKTGAVTDFNRMAHESLGYSRDQFARLTLADLEIPAPEGDRFDLRQAAVRLGEDEVAAYETQLASNGGGIRAAAFQIRRVEAGGRSYLQAAWQDVTGQRLLERQKVAVEQQLLQMQKLDSIGSLAGGIAHDFNNLLSPILGYSEMFLGEMKPDDPRRVEVRQIAKAAERGRDLVRQLLAFGRKQVFEIRPIDLNGLIRNFAAILRRTIREDVEIVYRLDDRLGPVGGDRTQLEMVLLNLAINAQDAMPRGGTLSFETGVATLDEDYAAANEGVKPGRYAMLAVSDTGIGMEKSILVRIFEPFFTTKEKGKGTGLGLSTVYGIAKQLGGHIYVYSELGQGTTFRLYFPLVPGSEAGIPEGGEAAEAAGGEPGRRETVLIAEDDDLVREMVVSLLHRRGYQALQAESGEDCLRRVGDLRATPSLLITDVVMPGMNGRDLYDRLRQHYPGLRVLYMSGYTEDVITHHGVLDPGVEFIQKPFSLRVMGDRIRAILDR